MSDIPHAYPLILNKVASPHYVTPTLRRGRLLEWLNAAATCRAAVIAADAGYGKTTLLWQWERESAFPCFWYKLDRNDRDWTFHVSYLIEAINQRHDGFGRRAHSMLQQLGGPGSSRPGVAAYLLAEMHERLTEPCTFIIDDWQYVNAVTEVRGLWNQILRDAPPTCRFIFAGRSKPRLQFARFKTHAGYAELRTDALRFTEPEIDELFRDIYKDPLDPIELAELERRTEGWAASLQLVEVSLRERHTPEARRGFIQSITATSDNDLFEFLAEEVLDQQPEETRNFLLSTSILQQITPELAERLTGAHDGRRELLDLEQRGLFTNRLDDHRYRYHNLFRDFLERRLISERSEAEVIGLHIHAASYFETTEQWPEAIHHYLRAGLQRQAARLIAKHGEEVVAQGRLGLVDEWLQQLPDKTIRENARLNLLYGEACGIRGDWQRALEALEKARGYFNRKGDKRLEALSCLKLSSVLHYLGEVQDSARMASEGLDLVPDNDVATRLRLEGNVATTRTWMEEGFLAVAQVCKRIALEARARGLDHVAAIGFHNLGTVQRYIGDLEESIVNLERSAVFWDALPPNPFGDNFEFVEALLSLDQFSRAEQVAMQAVQRTRGWPRPYADALCGRSAVYAHAGRFVEAAEVLGEIASDERSLGTSAGPMGALWLDCLFLAESSSERHKLALNWVDRQPLDVRHTEMLAPSRALAQHTITECRGDCLDALASVEESERRGASFIATQGFLKLGILALSHRQRGASALALRAIARALESRAARHLRWWLRCYVPFSQDFLKSEAAATILERLLTTDPEGWRSTAVASLRWLKGNRRASMLSAIVHHASRPTLDELRALPGSDVAEARRQLAHQFAARLYVRTLGALEVRRGGWDGPEIRLGKKRLRLLFGLLVARAELNLTRDLVIDVLWPEAEAGSGINSLNQTVFQLRRALDPTYRDGNSPLYVISTVDTVSVSDELVRTDVQEIRRLTARMNSAIPHERAQMASAIVDLVRGEFLTDLRYEEWVVSAATAIHTDLRLTLLPIAQARFPEMPADISLRAAYALTRIDEFDEAAHIAMAHQLAASGRRAAARDAIVRFATRLATELDEEPQGDLRDALESLGVHRRLTVGSSVPLEG